MVRTVVNREGTMRCATKVRTGCVTCRIRKVKCDENKPFCLKCVKTGRTCDGYESPFRYSPSPTTRNVHAIRDKPEANFQIVNPVLTEITTREIELLNRYFSTKTIFNVRMGCDEEARQILHASLTNPSIRHALSSLRALREDLETSGDRPMYTAQQRSSYKYGLEQYSMALSGLTSNLLRSDTNGLKSVLLCCQIFISIEQVQGNWAAMAQHIIRGLRIMHEYRVRPHLTSTNKLMPADHVQLPLLDVYIVKMFAAPCRFADPTLAGTSATTPPVYDSAKSPHLRTIAPNRRTELTNIAASTLKFLSKVSHVESVESALRLLSEKENLLVSLESWLLDLELMQMETGSLSVEPISVSFMRCLQLILKIVLLSALNSPPDLESELQIGNHQLQEIANGLSERLKDYRMPSGTRSDREEQYIGQG